MQFKTIKFWLQPFLIFSLLSSMMINIATISWVLLMNIYAAYGQTTEQILNFKFEEVSLNGVLNSPEQGATRGIVLIIHGSGRTNAVAQNWYLDVRQAINEAGYSTFMWDKKGCGKSEGVFDNNQTVHNSAAEAIAAIRALQAKQIIGANKIGLWGISRAGWISPLIIQQFEGIQFWISVSGVDEKENFKYLLEENLRINGLPQDSINLIVNEWQTATHIVHSGGSYEAYLTATPHLRTNEFMMRFNNGRNITASDYYEYQLLFMKEKIDTQTGLQVYIENFETLLSKIKCPVLALFGEKDKQVDWRKTIALYEKTMNDNTNLTIKSFPDCNHNLFQCETGGFYEFQDNNLPWIRGEDFLETITRWLNELE